VRHPFFKTFFQQLLDKPLEAGDSRYVNLYGGPTPLLDDPVEILSRAIELSPGESVQLLSGYRGTGKTTELKRLEAKLVVDGYQVVYVDMDRHLNMTTEVDISDFLLVTAGAFGEAMRAPEHLGKDATQEGYWERFAALMTRTNVSLPEVALGAKVPGPAEVAAGLKLNLKSDPTFRKRLQEQMKGHIGTLVSDVRGFYEDCMKALKARHGAETEVVVLVDSVEKIRGTSLNAQAVQESVENLFAGHADKLKLPNLHLVYTVPPYLRVRFGQLGTLYGTSALQTLPARKVRGRDGERHAPGIDDVRKLVERRGDWRTLLRDQERMDRLIDVSGGNLRDLFQLLREIILRTTVTPASAEVVDEAINQMRREFLPIANADARWLAQIARTHGAALDDMKGLPDLARFFDTHLVLCYRNGPEWYDVHPLIKEIVLQQVEALEAAGKPATATS
jgi:hypothetical protein